MPKVSINIDVADLEAGVAFYAAAVGLTPIHLDFLVEDVESALGRAVSAGARTESTIEAYPWGRMAVLADPFGNGFCLIELDAVGYGAIATPYVR
jgi:predicted enzyme related to lactoylglutathione lyase